MVLASAVHVYAAAWVAEVRDSQQALPDMGRPDLLQVDIRLSDGIETSHPPEVLPKPASQTPSPPHVRKTVTKERKKGPATCYTEPGHDKSQTKSLVISSKEEDKEDANPEALSSSPVDEINVPKQVAAHPVLRKIPESDHLSCEESATPPGLTSPIRPRYPRSSRMNKEQGSVILRFLVRENGQAEDIRIVQGSGYKGLDKAAVTAVRKYRFLPAYQNHQPKESRCSLTITFRLNT